MDILADILVGFWLICGFLYLPLIGLLAYGVSKLPQTRAISDAEAVPVTVLVSARNEEKDLPACIKSLLALDYPVEKLQIVLVNDYSTDATGSIIDEVARLHPHVVAVHSEKMPDHGLKAKARGIANGFKVATGDWVMITDADACVHPQWVRHSLGNATEETGLIGGGLVIDISTSVSIVERASWAFVQLFNLGGAGWGIPFVCVGPNMIMRRKIYQEHGGLEVTGSGVAEDLALLNMVTSSGYKIQTLLSKETTVRIAAVPSWSHLFSQQRRWFRGGIEFKSEYALLLNLGFWWGFFCSTFIALGWIFFPVLWLVFYAIKLPLDLLCFHLQAKRFGAEKYRRFALVINLYQPIIFIFIPLSFLFTRKIQWKGDGFSVRFD